MMPYMRPRWDPMILGCANRGLICESLTSAIYFGVTAWDSPFSGVCARVCVPTEPNETGPSAAPPIVFPLVLRNRPPRGGRLSSWA